MLASSRRLPPATRDSPASSGAGAFHGKLSKDISAVDIKVQRSAEFADVSQLVDFIVLAAVERTISPAIARRNVILRRTIDRRLQADESEGNAIDAEPQLSPVKQGSNIVYQTLVSAGHDN